MKLHDRIFNLIGAWYNPHSPEGQVARASMNRWGVPLRLADVAELEYREWLYDANGAVIDQWAESSESSSYAGYYLDHRAGGKMRIGFTENQQAQLDDLKSTLNLVSQSRLKVYTEEPKTPQTAVTVTSDAVADAVAASPTLKEQVTSVSVPSVENVVNVDTNNVAQTSAILAELFGSNSPIVVRYATGTTRLTGRFRNKGRMRAGDNILDSDTKCTAGFGAYSKYRQNNRDIYRLFVLSAGHCFAPGQPVFRSPGAGFGQQEEWSKIGNVRRNAYSYEKNCQY